MMKTSTGPCYVRAFGAGITEADKPLYEGASLGTGDYTVVIVNSVNKVDPDTIEKEELDALRGQLLQAHVTSAWAEYQQYPESMMLISQFMSKRYNW